MNWVCVCMYIYIYIDMHKEVQVGVCMMCALYVLNEIICKCSYVVYEFVLSVFSVCTDRHTHKPMCTPTHTQRSAERCTCIDTHTHIYIYIEICLYMYADEPNYAQPCGDLPP